MRVAVSILLVAAALAGCATPAPQPIADPPASIEGREYELHVPAGLDGPAPLLLLLHGGLGSPETMRDKSGMDDLADQYGFIVAYPKGAPSSTGAEGKTWNAVHCCGTAHREDVDDVGFLVGLVATIQAAHDIDADRIGIGGHSNGAMMAYRAAAERPDVFTHVMAVAGAIGGQENDFQDVKQIPSPSQPVHALMIHARDDPNVRYEGGRAGGAEPWRIDLSVADAETLWSLAAGATGVQTTTDGAVETATFTGGDARVVRIATEGGHGWPGGRPLGVIHDLLVDTPADPDASRLIADFLMQP